MTELDRRQFLSRAALGGAAVVSVGSLGGAALASPEGGAGNVRVDGDDPNFFEGLVASIRDATLLVTSSSYLIRRVQVGNGTRVWKGGDATFGEIRPGDYVYASGVPGPNADFLADAIWVNIVNLHVEIESIHSDRLQLNHVGGPIVGHLKPDTVVAYNDGPETRDLSRLRPGLHVQMIGAWRPGKDEMDVTRIYAPV